jgi:hypothetical protein
VQAGGLLKKTGLGLVVALGLCVLPASAGKVTYRCDPNTISADLCNALNTTVGGEYAQLFENANANIYIQMGHVNSSVVGSNFQFYTTVDYSAYYNALSAGISGAADAAAVSSLPPAGPFANPIASGYQVSLTSALDAALGFSGARGVCVAGSLNCVPALGCALSAGPDSNPNCFNGIITISDSKNFYFGSGNYLPGEYDFFTVVRHETNEVLGTGSCVQGGTLLISHLCLNGLWGISPADLFRYTGPGQRGFTIGLLQNVTLSGPSAYFSIDGGVTSIAGLYNATTGADFGDLSAVCQHVQDSIGCADWSNTKDKRGASLMNDGGVEIAMLDAVGYRLTSQGLVLSAAQVYAPVYTPEPSSIELMSVAFGVSGIVWNRRKLWS